MTNRDEILDLLANGKITADEAVDMLSKIAVDTLPAAEKPTDPDTTATTVDQTINGKGPSWLHIRVRNLETGQNKVSVNIPLRMVNFGLKLGRHFSSDLDSFDAQELKGLMSEMGTGMLVDVQDEEDNEHVQIFVD